MIKEQVKLAEEISNYIRRNPGAGDTLEGITTWWLKPGKTKPPVKKTAAALEILVKKGLIRKRQIQGGTTLYKAASARETARAGNDGIVE
jgi:hypothetical protein